LAPAAFSKPEFLMLDLLDKAPPPAATSAITVPTAN
jgi:hypothetical protein